MTEKRILAQSWSMVEACFELEGVHTFAGVEEMLAQQKQDDNAFPSQRQDDLLDVSFLKYPHRHIFKFSIKVDVNHDDRDIEFIQLARLLKQAMLVRYPIGAYGCSNFGNSSCEMLGKEVVQIFGLLFPNYEGKVLIRVSEDGENSALACFVIYKPLEEVAESEQSNEQTGNSSD